MDAIGRFVADAVLGTDTLWGGDVMCPWGTGRFIADSWFSDEPLPAAYNAPAGARVRASGAVASKLVAITVNVFLTVGFSRMASKTNSWRQPQRGIGSKEGATVRKSLTVATS
jgi:hypothetical protein